KRMGSCWRSGKLRWVGWYRERQGASRWASTSLRVLLSSSLFMHGLVRLSGLVLANVPMTGSVRWGCCAPGWEKRESWQLPHIDVITDGGFRARSGRRTRGQDDAEQSGPAVFRTIGQAFLQCLDQQAYLGQRVTALWVDGPNGGGGRLMGFEQRHQFAPAQRLLHVVVRELTQAEAAQGRIQHRLAAVAAPVAAGLEGLLAAIDLQHPGIAGAHQAVVSRQFGKGVRAPVAFQ